MIIVYQSLESHGEKENTGLTAFTVNNFTQQTQENIHTILPNATTFATPHEIKKLAKKFQTDRLRHQLELSNELNKIIAHIENSVHHSKALHTPDVIVLGEIAGNDLTLGSIIGNYIVIGKMNPTGDARHRFTIFKKKSLSDKDVEVIYFPYEKVDPSNTGKNAKCAIMKIMGWLIAFVHIPNNICGKPAEIDAYIKSNVHRAIKGDGQGLDLLIGDTNQPSSHTIQHTLMTRYNEKPWHSSVLRGKQEVHSSENYAKLLLKGTNSAFNKHFDIACSPYPVQIMQNNTPTMTGNVAEAAFTFHSLVDKFIDHGIDKKLYAFSDHNGVVVEILHQKEIYEMNPDNAPQKTPIIYSLPTYK